MAVLQSFYVIFLDDCETLVVPLMCLFRIVSLLVTRDIHINILFSFTYSRPSCRLVVAVVPAPYNRAGLARFRHILFDFSFKQNEMYYNNY